MLQSFLAEISQSGVKEFSWYASNTHTHLDAIRQLSSDIASQYKKRGHDELPPLRVGNIELSRPNADDLERTLQDEKFPEHFLSLCHHPDLLAATVKVKPIMDSIIPACMDKDIMKSMRNLYKKKNFMKALEELKENPKFIEDIYPYIHPIFADKVFKDNFDAMQQYIEKQKRPTRRLLSDEAASSSALEKKIHDKATEIYCKNLLRDESSQGEETEYCQRLLEDKGIKYDRAYYQQPVRYDSADRRKPIIHGYNLSEIIVGGGFYLSASVISLIFFGKFLSDQRQGRNRRLKLEQDLEKKSKKVEELTRTIHNLETDKLELNNKLHTRELLRAHQLQKISAEHDSQLNILKTTVHSEMLKQQLGFQEQKRKLEEKINHLAKANKDLQQNAEKVKQALAKIDKNLKEEEQKYTKTITETQKYLQSHPPR